MTEATLSIPEPIFSASARPESLSALIWRRFKRHRLALVSAILLGLMTVLVMSAPFSAYSATQLDSKDEFAKPLPVIGLAPTN